MTWKHEVVELPRSETPRKLLEPEAIASEVYGGKKNAYSAVRVRVFNV